MTSRVVFSESRHTYSLDGRWAPSVTGVLNKAIGKPGLISWSAKLAAQWAATHVEELDLRGFDDFVTAASLESSRSRDKSADDGRLLHLLAESLVYGDELPAADAYGMPYPEHIVKSAEQLARFFDEWEVEPLAHESFVFHEQHHWCGRLDLIADLLDGKRWLLDYKTGQSGVWPETSLQLSAYGHATHIVIEDIDHPMPHIDCAGAVWVRPDGYELIPVKYDDDTYTTFGHAMRVAEWVSQKRDVSVMAALPVPERKAS